MGIVETLLLVAASIAVTIALVLPCFWLLLKAKRGDLRWRGK
jgi:hypothetical protein